MYFNRRQTQEALDTLAWQAYDRKKRDERSLIRASVAVILATTAAVKAGQWPGR